MTWVDIYDDIWGDLSGPQPPTGPTEDPLDLLSWVEPDGDISPLSGDLTIMSGPVGLRTPPTRRAREQVAGLPGTRLRHLTDDIRTVEIPVMFTGANEPDLRLRMLNWEQKLDPNRGEGKIRAQTLVGNTLELRCRCVRGTEGNDDGSHRYPGANIRLATLEFEADDPYWYEVNGQTKVFTFTSAGSSNSKWFSPGEAKGILPIQLGSTSSSGSSGISTINVAGQANTWPVWIIQGPGGPFQLANFTTGRVITYGASLAAGQLLVIDHTPGLLASGLPRRRVEIGGVSQFQHLTAWDFWDLRPGPNMIVVTAGSGVTASTQAILTWYPAWRGF